MHVPVTCRMNEHILFTEREVCALLQDKLAAYVHSGRQAGIQPGWTKLSSVHAFDLANVIPSLLHQSNRF